MAARGDGDWRKSFFALTVEGKTMPAFACVTLLDLLIPLGFLLGLGVVIALVIIYVFKSGEPK